MPKGKALNKAISEQGFKICTGKDCQWEGSVQPLASFYVRKNGSLDAVCKDCRKQRSKERYSAQSAEIREQQSTYRNSPRVKRRLYDRSKRKAYHREYNEAHKEAHKSNHEAYLKTAEGRRALRWAGNRRAVRMLQNGGQHSAAQWLAVQVKQQMRCAYCGRRCDSNAGEGSSLKPTKDHIIPIKKGGSDDISNIVLACWDCNMKKGANEFWVPQTVVGGSQPS